jgi:hypothetical protein
MIIRQGLDTTADLGGPPLLIGDHRVDIRQRVCFGCCLFGTHHRWNRDIMGQTLPAASSKMADVVVWISRQIGEPTALRPQTHPL